MWFDVSIALAEIEAVQQPALVATIATPATQSALVADVADVALPPEPNPDILVPGVAEVTIVAGPCRSDPETAATRTGSDDLLVAFEERAAIRQFDGGQDRDLAEADALKEIAHRAGLATSHLQRRWADHPDAQHYLALLARKGPQTVEVAAAALGWTLARAWQAEARLRASGLLRAR